MKKNLGNAAIVTLSLGTAYGLGIITCAYVGLKLFAECLSEYKSDKKSHRK